MIGGFTLPRGTRLHFGALLVGLYEGKALRFCGAVGTGFSDEVLLGLLEKLHPLQRDACPFASVPREVKDATWVAPKLVAQVAYAEWTGDEKLRQPAFLGLRNDKKPSECRWEKERNRSAWTAWPILLRARTRFAQTARRVRRTGHAAPRSHGTIVIVPVMLLWTASVGAHCVCVQP